MRGASKVTLVLHQILCLPREMRLMIDPPHIRNLNCNARSNKSQPLTSPNTAPATQNTSHDWSASHMKPHLQCTEQKSQPPTSPNTAPATQNESHDWSASHMKPHLQCTEQQESASNFTYCACHESFQDCSGNVLNCFRQNKDDSTTFRAWSEQNPSRIRTENRHLAPAASETLLVGSWRRFCIEKYNMSRSCYMHKFHGMVRLPRKVTIHLQQILRLPQKLTLHLHHLLRLPRKMHSTLLYSILLASILSWHLFSLGI